MADKSEKKIISLDDSEFQSNGVYIEGSHFKPASDGGIIETTTGWDDKTDVLHHQLPLTIGHGERQADGTVVQVTVVFQETRPASPA